PERSRAMVAAIAAARDAGDTLGGVVALRASGVVPGLGSFAEWDRRLDGRIAQALMSIQSAKGVQFADAFVASRERGSAVHDPIAVEGGAPSLARGDERVGELHAFRALDRHERLRDAAVQTAVPLGERAETRDDTARAQRDDATERVPGVARGGDRRDHRPAALRIRAPDLALLDRVASEARLAGNITN